MQVEGLKSRADPEKKLQKVELKAKNIIIIIKEWFSQSYTQNIFLFFKLQSNRLYPEVKNNK